MRPAVAAHGEVQFPRGCQRDARAPVWDGGAAGPKASCASGDGGRAQERSLYAKLTIKSISTARGSY